MNHKCTFGPLEELKGLYRIKIIIFVVVVVVVNVIIIIIDNYISMKIA